MKCKKCGSSNLQIVTVGPHKKLVCVDCLTYQKFLSKSQIKIFNQLQDEEKKEKYKKNRKF
jgi:late competence protein required for DNA uptake (superfamily II DNA/RNA helicase)